jgi:aspartyl-tRNA(Asn)/glutamyl-tRNA(Gln) amidotransferase subunit A
MCFASIGTDTGGSIRIPAAACGLVGLKPTFGEVPAQGVVPLAWSLDHVGPLARSVDDARLLLQVLRGDARDLRDNPPAARAHDLRLRPLEHYFVELLEPGVREAYGVAIAALRNAGVQTTPAVIPHAPLTGAVYLPTVLAEAMAYHRPTLDRCPELYQPSVRIRLEMGRYVPGEDYVRAARGREVLTREVDAALQGADALVLPTLPIVAPRLGESTVAFGLRRDPVRNVTLRLTQLFDVTGHPAITLPIGDAEPGLPAGLQLVGHRGYTDRLLAVAKAVEGVLHSMLR